MKQILLVNDVVGYSHVGMVAMLPILTHQGHAVFNLPTALVSNTLDYGRFNTLETTDYMRGTLPVWHKLGFRFDAICTGLMFSEEQARLVSAYCREMHSQGSTIFVDPIMGDAGRLYNGMGQKQVELMRDMVSVADLTMPNFTEACYLAGMPYPTDGIDEKGSLSLLDAVAGLGAKSVVITSALVDGQRCVLGYGDGLSFRINYTELPKAFHGTGDIFSAVLIGKLMNGNTLKDGTHAAMTVVSRLIERNLDQQDTCLGIPVEQCMDLL